MSLDVPRYTVMITPADAADVGLCIRLVAPGRVDPGGWLDHHMSVRGCDADEVTLLGMYFPLSAGYTVGAVQER